MGGRGSTFLGPFVDRIVKHLDSLELIIAIKTLTAGHGNCYRMALGKTLSVD